MYATIVMYSNVTLDNHRKGHGYGSVAQCLPSQHKTLNSIHGTKKYIDKLITIIIIEGTLVIFGCVTFIPLDSRAVFH